MKRADFTITVEFVDGKVQLGAGDEMFVEPIDGRSSVTLDGDRLDLIKALQQVEEELTDG